MVLCGCEWRREGGGYFEDDGMRKKRRVVEWILYWSEVEQASIYVLVLRDCIILPKLVACYNGLPMHTMNYCFFSSKR